MKKETKKHSRLQELLIRFMDEEPTPDQLESAHHYLFENGRIDAASKDNIFTEVLLYLKDIMFLNHLYSMDDIFVFYEMKRKAIAGFIHQAQMRITAEHLSSFTYEESYDINWKKEIEIQGPVQADLPARSCSLILFKYDHYSPAPFKSRWKEQGYVSVPMDHSFQITAWDSFRNSCFHTHYNNETKAVFFVMQTQADEHSNQHDQPGIAGKKKFAGVCESLEQGE